MKDELQKSLHLLSSTTPLAGDHGWTSEECLSHHVPITRLVDEHNWLGRRGWTSFPFCGVEHTNCPCQVIMSALFNGTIKNFTSNLVSRSECCVLIARSGGGAAAAAALKHIGWMVCLHLSEKKTDKRKREWKQSHTFSADKLETDCDTDWKRRNGFLSCPKLNNGPLRSLNYLSDLHHRQLFEIWPKHSASFENEAVGLLSKKGHFASSLRAKAAVAG